jgi:hypothetical protein
MCKRQGGSWYFQSLENTLNILFFGIQIRIYGQPCEFALTYLRRQMDNN